MVLKKAFLKVLGKISQKISETPSLSAYPTQVTSSLHSLLVDPDSGPFLFLFWRPNSPKFNPCFNLGVRVAVFGILHQFIEQSLATDEKYLIFYLLPHLEIES